jgi:hypothetical protein
VWLRDESAMHVPTLTARVCVCETAEADDRCSRMVLGCMLARPVLGARCSMHARSAGASPAPRRSSPRIDGPHTHQAPAPNKQRNSPPPRRPAATRPSSHSAAAPPARIVPGVV